jgi:hypothetical protein
VDAVFVAAGVTALLIIGVVPVGVRNVADYYHVPGSPGARSVLIVALAAGFLLAVITLLKGKPWTALLGLFVPALLVVGAVRLARPGSMWARWRYRRRPAKRARALRRERRLREPIIRAKNRVQDILTGLHDGPDGRDDKD